MTLMEQIDTLSPEASLNVMEALWNRLRSSSSVPTPHWHEEELARRDQMVADGSAAFSNWDETRARLLAQLEK